MVKNSEILSLYDSYVQELTKIYKFFNNLSLKDLDKWIIVQRLNGDYYLTKMSK